MRVIRLTVAALVIIMLLDGCGLSGEVENQAYVLELGIDMADSGALELTARVPRIGKSKEAGDDGGDGDDYLTFSVAGADWSQALEALQWATPRRTNLSHIEALIVSESAAASPLFPELLRRVIETPHLYATTRLVVCQGRAGDFIRAQKTVIGTRMSAEMYAMFRHYADLGYIPDTCLADVAYGAEAFYSDPVAIWARLPDGNPSGASILESPMEQRYGGAALFRAGRFVAGLDLWQTRLLNLVRGSVKEISLECDSASCQLCVNSGPRLRVVRDDGNARLELSVALTAMDDPDADVGQMEATLRRDVEALIRRCQALRVDPFGFADRAAMGFLTIPDWLSWDWRGQYSEADVGIQISVSRP